MTDLCEEFGISRKAGYRLRDRFATLGVAALVDGSRAPKRVANRTSAEIRELLVTTRLQHPSWGPRKLRAWLLYKHQGLTLPAASTIGDLLRREGLVEPRRMRRSTPGVDRRTLAAGGSQPALVCRLQGRVPTRQRAVLLPADHHRPIQSHAPGVRWVRVHRHEQHKAGV